MNKPYLLLAGDDYYPRHDTGNWIDRFRTEKEAENHARKLLTQKEEWMRPNWYKIVNSETWTKEND